MKKIISAIAALFITSLMLLSFAACEYIDLPFGSDSEPTEGNAVTNDHVHTYKKSWTYDETHHWKAATCTEFESCSTAKSRYEEHTFKNSICTVCYATSKHTHTYDNDCDEYCNICDLQRTAPHIFDNSCDADCNGCFYSREVEHDPEDDDGDCTTAVLCKICGEAVIEESVGHLFTTACDTSCNAENCIYTREITHNYTNVCDEVCNDCKYHRDDAHTFGSDNICTECSYGSAEDPRETSVPLTFAFTHTPGEASSSVWYKFTTGDAVVIGVSIGENTLMSFGSDKEAMTEVAYDEEAAVKMTLDASTTYYFSLTTKDSQSGDISLTVKCYNLYTEVELPLYGKTIVSFGDSIFGNNNTETGVCNQLALNTGAAVYNCAFGGTRAYPRKENAASANEPYRHFDMMNLIDAIVANDYTNQDAALTPDEDGKVFNSRFPAMLERIKNLTFTDQIVTLNHDTNDWNSAVPIEVYQDALRYIINKIQENYQNVRIVLISPTWRCTFENGEYVEGGNDTAERNGKTNYDYAMAMKEVAEEMGVDFIDCYNIGIDATNCLDYFNGVDGTHHDERGRAYLAKHIATELAKIINN